MEADAHYKGGSGELPRNFFKIYVFENAFQAILKPSFPYSITSILSTGGGGGGGGGVLLYFHTYVGSGYFFFLGGGGIKILNFDILGGFQKKDILFGEPDKTSRDKTSHAIF